MQARSMIMACAVVLVAGCSSPITKQDQASLAKPINCATAEGDLRVLASEKAHVGSEIANGVSAIVPIGLVVNLADGQEKARMEVATGDYNKMIDTKIAAIKAQCGSK
jgi:hypothetical protein